jgi:hypothetical protein
MGNLGASCEVNSKRGVHDFPWNGAVLNKSCGYGGKVANYGVLVHY